MADPTGNDRWRRQQAAVAAMIGAKVLPLTDPRRLNVLNRAERRLWNKFYQGDTTMLIDLTQSISATAADGTPLQDRDGKAPVLRELALTALRTALPEDQNSGFEAKNKRYLLVKRIVGDQRAVELAAEEIELIRSRAGRVFLDCELVGGIGEALAKDAGAEPCTKPDVPA